MAPLNRRVTGTKSTRWMSPSASTAARTSAGSLPTPKSLRTMTGITPVLPRRVGARQRKLVGGGCDAVAMSSIASAGAVVVGPAERLEVLFEELSELAGQRNAIDG